MRLIERVQQTPEIQGWSIDTGDSSVGLFGTEAIHENCPKWDEDSAIIGDDRWTEVGRIYEPKSYGVEVVSLIQVTCGACGEVLWLSQQDISSLADEENYFTMDDDVAHELLEAPLVISPFAWCHTHKRTEDLRNIHQDK